MSLPSSCGGRCSSYWKPTQRSSGCDMNPSNKKYTNEQIRTLRLMVWRDGLSQREAVKRLGLRNVGGSLWLALHGYAYKTAGGPTGRGERTNGNA